MPSLSVGVPHSLGLEEATRRLKAEFNKVRDQFGDRVSDLEEQWNGNELRFGFTTYGVRVRGTVTTGESDVRIAANLPLVALPLKGKIEQRVRQELGRILA